MRSAYMIQIKNEVFCFKRQRKCIYAVGKQKNDLNKV